MQLQERMIRKPELLRITGLSYASIYRLMRDGKFPNSILIGKRAVGWRESQIVHWLNTR